MWSKWGDSITHRCSPVLVSVPFLFLLLLHATNERTGIVNDVGRRGGRKKRKERNGRAGERTELAQMDGWGTKNNERLVGWTDGRTKGRMDGSTNKGY